MRVDSVLIEVFDDPYEDNAIGISAGASVSYPINQNGDRRIEWLSSGGLYGIEANASDEHLDQVKQEELDDLKDHLGKFGIPTDETMSMFKVENHD